MPDPRTYIPQEQGGPVILASTEISTFSQQLVNVQYPEQAEYSAQLHTLFKIIIILSSDLQMP
jgi:hypothetical protein